MTRAVLDASAYSAFMRGHPELKHALQQVDEIEPFINAFLMKGRSSPGSAK